MPVQRRHRPGRVPPIVAQRVETRDLLVDDARRRRPCRNSPGRVGVDRPGSAFIRAPQRRREPSPPFSASGILMARLVMKFGGTSRRQCRAHPQRRAPRQTRGRRGPRGRGRRLGDVGQDQRTRRLVPRGGAALRRRRIRRGRRLGRTRHRRPARDRAQGHGAARALLAGLADPAHDRRRARRGAHRRHRRQEDHRRLRARRDRGRRRLSGPPRADAAG